MTQIHTSYEFSRKLKAFLGESAPEPMGSDYYSDRDIERELILHYNMELLDNMYPAYQLHDLLSKPFCEAFIKERFARGLNSQSAAWEVVGYLERVVNAYYSSGLPAVEKALTEMMEAK